MMVVGGEDAITEHKGRQVQEAHSLLRGTWCLNWGLEEQSSWLSLRGNLPRRESICLAPEVRWQPPHFGSRHVCPSVHGHTHVWVWVKYYIRIRWVNGYKERGEEGQESRTILEPLLKGQPGGAIHWAGTQRGVLTWRIVCSVLKVWNLWASEPVHEDCLIDTQSGAQRKISAAGLGCKIVSTWISVVKGEDKNHLGECMQSDIRRKMRVDLRKTWDAKNKEKKKKICGVVSREA